MVASPPRGGPSKLSANLFAEEASEQKHPLRRFAPRRRPSQENRSILCPLDLDLNVATVTGGAPPFQRRKRPCDSQPAGRQELWEDSDEDMFHSPRSSPTSHHRSSPTSYRTLDGRTVTSKNPFSPYTPMEDAGTGASSPMAKMKNAPDFPEDLLQPTSSSITLQRRSSPFRQTYFGPSKNGFPDQHGRYSFTGSPIEEVDMTASASLDNHNNKIRRLYQDDISRSRRNLYINTNLDCTVKDEISPTDVLSFPPPTPMKRGRSTYTPLRTAPPQTPAMEHRQRGRRPEEDQDIMIESSSAKSKSRFEQDFDIIGQLGNGSFGTVYKCLSRLDGCMYAVKAAKRKAKGVADRDRMLKEVCCI
jgi:hypothetical protein